MKHPFCHWCGVEVKRYKKPDGKLKDNSATIDHLYSRYNPLRYVQPKNTEVTVLACHKCNNERSNEETSSLSKEELHFRSSNHLLLIKNLTLVLN